MNEGLIKFLFNQGIGVGFGALCLAIWWYNEKKHAKERDDLAKLVLDDKRYSEDKLRLISAEGRQRGDDIMELMGELKAYLAATKSFESIAKHAIADTLLNRDRRRSIDDFIQERLEKGQEELKREKERTNE